VNTNHYFIVKTFEEELSSPLKGNVGKKSRKKRPNVFKTTITNFLLQKIPLGKMCSKN
jgi:hypothetical protein